MALRRLLALSALALALALPAVAQTPIRKAWTPMPDAKLASIPVFNLPEKYKDRRAYPLPAAVDNSKLKYFPPYKWNQQGNSCAHAQAVSYNFTYAMNFARDKAVSGTTPEFTYEYTYHFTNGGDQSEGGDGWSYVEAWDILKETGAASSVDFGGFEWGNRFNGWMSGYDKYYNAMKNRVKEYYRIDASVAAGDEVIKQYLVDQADGSPAGGMLVFQARSVGWETAMMGTRRVITSFDKGGGHALGIIGYDDGFNGGSWMCVNSWGDGFYWVPYRLLRAGGNLATAQGMPVMFCKADKGYTPKLAFKVRLTHDQRSNIAIMTGVAGSAAAAAPTRTKDYAGAFNFASDANPMLGRGVAGPIEIGLDLTAFLADLEGKEGRLFLRIVSKGGTGQVQSLSLMDYTGGQPREITAREANKAIAPNGVTLVSIPWSASSSIRLAPMARSLPARPGSPLRDAAGRLLRAGAPMAAGKIFPSAR